MGAGEGGGERGKGRSSGFCSQLADELDTPPGVMRDFVTERNEIGERGTLGGGLGDIGIVYRERHTAEEQVGRDR